MSSAAAAAAAKKKKDFDFQFKILVVGDSSVGKTSLSRRFAGGTVNTDHKSTIGVDHVATEIVLDNKRISLQIWDTAGQERFSQLTAAYYRGAHGIFLVYDVTNLASFHHVATWVQNIERQADADVVWTLIGNKCDASPDLRIISKETGQEFANARKVQFYETSAYAEINVRAAIEDMSRRIKANKVDAVASQTLAKESQSKEVLENLKNAALKGYKNDTVDLNAKNNAASDKKGCC